MEKGNMEVARIHAENGKFSNHICKKFQMEKQVVLALGLKIFFRFNFVKKRK